jgi:hypothetical protein
MKTITTHTLPDDLVDLFKQSLQDPLNRLPHNYVPEDLDNEDHICYSVTYDSDGDCICGSVARMRDFYNGGVRLLSKYYISKKIKPVGMRVNKYHKNGMSTFAVEQADQQIEFCKKNYDVNKFFISREYKNPRSIKNLCRGMEHNSKYKGWTLEKDLWQTAPNNTDDCWQYIVWLGGNPLNDSKTIY